MCVAVFQVRCHMVSFQTRHCRTIPVIIRHPMTLPQGGGVRYHLICAGTTIVALEQIAARLINTHNYANYRCELFLTSTCNGAPARLTKQQRLILYSIC